MTFISIPSLLLSYQFIPGGDWGRLTLLRTTKSLTTDPHWVLALVLCLHSQHLLEASALFFVFIFLGSSHRSQPLVSSGQLLALLISVVLVAFDMRDGRRISFPWPQGYSPFCFFFHLLCWLLFSFYFLVIHIFFSFFFFGLSFSSSSTMTLIAFSLPKFVQTASTSPFKLLLFSFSIHQ